MIVASRCDEGMQRLWLQCGGRETLQSYDPPSPHKAIMDVVPADHWRFLEKTCVNWFETDRHFFVHASVYPDVPLEQQPSFMLLWESLYDPVRHFSGKVMVCGHTRQMTGMPRNLGSTICIDTGAHAHEGWLTCLDVDAGRYWQADQKDRRRQGVLREPNL
jgi:serine/threonine protein phosphatase 1